jgi:tetratricopeptide (TPR) repeat protein
LILRLVELGKNSWVFEESTISHEIEMEFDRAVDLWHAKQIEMAEHVFHHVIAECPNHIDAIHHLSIMYDGIGRSIEAYLCCRAAVGIGLQAIPEKRFSWKKSKLEWRLGNRPFMRAYHNLGLKHLYRNEYEEAIEIFERLLSVNPNDDQGLRYLLPLCWFATDEPSKIVVHCQSYPDDSAPEILYSHTLALVLTNQNSLAREVMVQAVGQLPLVAKELLEKRCLRLRDATPENVIHGGNDQAYSYGQQFGQYWLNSDAAIELLTQTVNADY